MIKSIHLENFQTHKNLELEFTSGLNVLIGKTDCGKSTVIRALSWVINNDFTGIGMIHHGAKEARVTVTTDKGDTVTRSRSKSTNRYIVNGKTFEGFGNSVPDIVNDVFKMDGKINWSFQFDPLYLISESPSEVAREVNRIADMTGMQKVQNIARDEVRKADNLVKMIEAEIRDTEKELESLSEVPSCKKRFTEIEERNKVLEDLDKKFSKGYDLLEDMKACQDKQVDTKQFEKSLSDIEAESDKLNKMVDKKSALHTLLVRIKELEDSITPNIDSFLVRVTDLISRDDYVTEKYKQLEDVEKVFVQITSLEKMYNEKAEKIKCEERKFQDEFPEICPLCGQSKKS